VVWNQSYSEHKINGTVAAIRHVASWIVLDHFQLHFEAIAAIAIVVGSITIGVVERHHIDTSQDSKIFLLK